MLHLMTVAVLCMASVLAAPPANTTPPGTSNQSTKKPMNIYHSAVFVCGDHIFQDNVVMLFPPADDSLPNIVNATLAEIVFSQSYRSFCDKLDMYTACVNILVNRNYIPVDSMVKQYIDFRNFHTALKAYCANDTLVTEQFTCTKSKTERNGCSHGGIVGIIRSVAMAIKNRVSKQQYCSELQASIRCRLDKQLKPCNTEYAKLMEFVYTNLTNKYCQ